MDMSIVSTRAASLSCTSKCAFVLHLKLSVYRACAAAVQYMTVFHGFCAACGRVYEPALYVEACGLQGIFSLSYSLLRNRVVFFGSFGQGSKHQNKRKIRFFGLMKQNEKQQKQIEFRHVSV